MEYVGKIIEIETGKKFIIEVLTDKTYIPARYSNEEVKVVLQDKRKITSSQRKKIYAILGDISIQLGTSLAYIKTLLKQSFCEQYEVEDFSFSDCDVSTAFQFTEFLIDFCLENDIQTNKPLLTYASDIGRYIYACAANKKSCLSNFPAELHHLDAVGMGNDRTEIIHKGMLVLPLTREEHTMAHKIGKDEFCKRYNIHGIRLNDELCEIWNLKH